MLATAYATGFAMGHSVQLLWLMQLRWWLRLFHLPADEPRAVVLLLAGPAVHAVADRPATVATDLGGG
jgi:hypothetical protein